MTLQLSLEETETVIQQTADNRSEWIVSTEDVVFQRKMERLGIESIYVSNDGQFKQYKLTLHNIAFKKGKRVISEETRLQLASRLREARKLHTAQASKD